MMDSIAMKLRDHLASSNTATINDLVTDGLYRQARRIPEDAETDLEEVEEWAVDCLNGLRQQERDRAAWDEVARRGKAFAAK